MENGLEALLKEIKVETAHLPNTPFPAIMPCPQPRLYISMFFDGTGNERLFDFKQYTKDLNWLMKDKAREQALAQESLAECLRVETEAASASKQAQEEVLEYRAEVGQLQAQADQAMREWQARAREMTHARTLTTSGRSAADREAGSEALARLHKVEDRALSRWHRLEAMSKDLDERIRLAEDQYLKAEDDRRHREQATVQARRDCIAASPVECGPTNVAKLYEIFNYTGHDGDGTDKVRRRIYIRGVGTREGEGIETKGAARIGLATGSFIQGGENRIPEAGEQLLREIRNVSSTWGSMPASITIDLFGFSRGAALARHFVNVILAGIPDTSRKPVPVTGEPLPFGEMVTVGGRDGKMSASASTFRTQLRYPSLPNVTIRFLGLFDTVGSFFMPGNDDEGCFDLGLPQGCAQHIVHLVAAQEWRENFPLTSIIPGEGEEIVMAGAHADIGGGYQLVEKCTLLMDEEYCGSVSADEFRQRGECALPQQREQRAREAILERVRQKGLLDENGGLPDGWYFSLGWKTSAGAASVVHFTVRLMRDKLTCNGYANVPLHIMHRKAVAAGVRFDDLNENEAIHAVPEDLRHLVDNPVEELPQDLWETYVHVSATANTVVDRLADRPRARFPASIGMHLDHTGERSVFANRLEKGGGLWAIGESLVSGRS
jgi:hypothetical protein